MSESQNIQIPTDLFDKIIMFFEFTNLTDYEFPSFYNHQDILVELQKKRHSINLRKTYTKYKQSATDEQRRLAYADYLKARRKKID